MKKLVFYKNIYGIKNNELQWCDSYCINEHDFFNSVSEDFKTESLSDYDIMRIKELSRLEKDTMMKDEIKTVFYYTMDIVEFNEDNEVVDSEELKSFYELNIPLADIRN